MKKALCVVLTVTLLMLPITGCSDKKQSSKEAEKEEEEEVIEFDKDDVIDALEDNGYVKVDSLNDVANNSNAGINSYAVTDMEKVHILMTDEEKDISEDYTLVCATSVNWTDVFCYEFDNKGDAKDAYNVFKDYLYPDGTDIPDGCEIDEKHFKCTLYHTVFQDSKDWYAGLYLHDNTMIYITTVVSSEDISSICKTLDLPDPTGV